MVATHGPSSESSTQKALFGLRFISSVLVWTYRNLQTWLESRLDQLAATGWSLLTLILQQEVNFMGSGEGSEPTAGFSQMVSRALLPSTAHFLMTHAPREYTCVWVGRRTHSVHKPATVSCCGAALRFEPGVGLESHLTHSQQHRRGPTDPKTPPKKLVILMFNSSDGYRHREMSLSAQ